MRRRTPGVPALALAFVLAYPLAAKAGCASTTECLAVLEKAREGLQTLEADFTQVKRVSLLNEPLESSGRFVFKSPDRLLLQMERPNPTRILIRGREIEIPGLPEAERRNMQALPMAGMFSQLGAVFTGSLRELAEVFELRARQVGETIEVEMEPRDEAGRRMVHMMRLRFGGSELLIEEIHIEEALGDSLTITLENVHENTGVPEERFRIGAEP